MLRVHCIAICSENVSQHEVRMMNCTFTETYRNRFPLFELLVGAKNQEPLIYIIISKPSL